MLNIRNIVAFANTVKLDDIKELLSRQIEYNMAIAEAGLLGMQMYMHDSQFRRGDGLVAKDVEDTIRAVSTIAREGMRETDNEIIHFMIAND